MFPEAHQAKKTVKVLNTSSVAKTARYAIEFYTDDYKQLQCIQCLVWMTYMRCFLRHSCPKEEYFQLFSNNVMLRNTVFVRKVCISMANFDHYHNFHYLYRMCIEWDIFSDSLFTFKVLEVDN